MRPIIHHSGIAATGSSSDAIALLAGVYTSISIIVVFHMFALQLWLQDTQEIGRLAWDTDQRATAHSLERTDLLERVKIQRSAFPTVQLLLLGGAMVALCGLSIMLAFRAHTLPLYFTIGPTVVLLFVFVSVTVAIRTRGLMVLRDAGSQLQSGQNSAKSL